MADDKARTEHMEKKEEEEKREKHEHDEHEKHDEHKAPCEPVGEAIKGAFDAITHGATEVSVHPSSDFLTSNLFARSWLVVLAPSVL